MRRRKLWIVTLVVCVMSVLFSGVTVFAMEPNTGEIQLEGIVPGDGTESQPEEGNPGENDAEQGTEQAAFSCFAYDADGKKLQGFWDEEDGQWYLFVPSTVSLADMKLHFTGSMETASAGVLDKEAGTVTGAFAQSGDKLELTDADGNTSTVLAYQSDLPSVYIDLEGTTLETIHQDKDKKYKTNSVYIADPNGDYDLTVTDNVEVKGRGNSTWRLYEKKGYQIKFESKTSVLGMGKAKKWVLLANAGDDSMMRTKLVYEMADKLGMAYVPSFEYVDLWIEGEYRGTYILGEKVEPGSTRLDLQNDAGALFEHDEAFYAEEDYWFFSEMLQRHFVLKEIVEEEDAIIADAMADFKAAADELAAYLYSTPSKEATLEKLSTMIDVDSFIKYYLINEYALNRESFNTSFYWYKDGPDDVIHLGPIWDFDTCMGNDGEPNTASYGTEHFLFRYLLASPEFNARAQELLETYRADLESMTDNVDVIKAKIADSAKMNYLRWNVLGKPNPKGGTDFHATFDEAAQFVKDWLEGREAAFEIGQCSVTTTAISEDCQYMDIAFDDGQEHDSILFAVWCIDGGQDDLGWYTAKQDENGVWRCRVDLGNHNSAGMYYVDTYAGSERTLISDGRNYVQTAATARYPIETVLSEDGTMLTVTMTDAEASLSAVRFGIWGITTGQEDSLKWVIAERNADNQWSITVPVCRFNLAGEDILTIHAYGTEDAEEKFVNTASEAVKTAVPHTYENGICGVCGAAEGETDTIASTPMYRLYNPNSGEHFYTGSEEERDMLANLGWQYEGVAWHAPIFEGNPVYRVFNPNSGDHHYTMSQDEVDNLTALGWQYEGVCWNSAFEGSEQYRLYNPNADLGSHHYTSSVEERDYLVSLGWIHEGTGWLGVVARVPAATDKAPAMGNETAFCMVVDPRVTAGIFSVR